MSSAPLPSSDDPALSVADLRFRYDRRSGDVMAIKRFGLAAGERVFLRGASGGGKSTLLGLIAGVLKPNAGTVEVLGEEMTALSSARRDAFRAERLGVIFQMFNLIAYLPVGANVTLPCRFSSAREHAAEAAGGVEAEARRLLSRLQLDPDEVWSKPSLALSVGQQQRVAAARALIGRPGLVLADEPTSALDSDSRDAFIGLLMEECAASGAALLFVSHDAGLADHFDRAEDLADINTAGRKQQETPA
ncbi:MAG: ATP-binding cassette domain-containing protein [Pseudomonadota bacterium]